MYKWWYMSCKLEISRQIHRHICTDINHSAFICTLCFTGYVTCPLLVNTFETVLTPYSSVQWGCSCIPCLKAQPHQANPRPSAKVVPWVGISRPCRLGVPQWRDLESYLRILMHTPYNIHIKRRKTYSIYNYLYFLSFINFLELFFDQLYVGLLGMWRFVHHAGVSCNLY